MVKNYKLECVQIQYKIEVFSYTALLLDLYAHAAAVLHVGHEPW